jgi:bacillithiol synthase
MTTMTGTHVITEPLGGSALARAVASRALPLSLQPAWPGTAQEWQAHASRVLASAASGWLEALLPAFGATGAAADRLAAAGSMGLVVTTGQQAGLFGGPLYTLSKAISVLSLADALQERIGLPVAPVFWAATDDADFLEASIAHVADADGLAALQLRATPQAGTPMSHAPLGDTTELLRRLHKACGSSAHDRYFEMARVAFAGQRTLGAAYVQLMRSLLQPLGIAVLDASHASVRAAARPTVMRALERAPDVLDALAGCAGALRAAGHEPQVGDERGLSLVFVQEQPGGAKRRLTVQEARSAHGRDPALLSPNVLLRPVVERSILPTAGYLAGPGELAYFPQAAAVAGALGAPVPTPVPRWSCTVVEPFAQRALSRLGVKPHELADVHTLEARFARAAMPANVTSAWERLQQRLTASLDELDAAVRDTALVPPPVVEGLRRSLSHRLGRAERRLLAAAKRRDDQIRRDLMVLSAALYPLGQRQERVLNFVPMLARTGDALLDSMRHAARSHAEALVGAERGEAVAR